MLIAFDTNIFIYWLDISSPFFGLSALAISLLNGGEVSGVVSVLTITELRAGMKSMRDASVLDSFGRKLVILPVSRQIVERAGDLRQKYPGLRTPDSVHLATAIEAGAKKFISNDKNLLKINYNAIELVPLVNLKSNEK